MKTIRETADILGVHWQTVRKWIKNGDIKVYKNGRIIRISEEEIERLKRGGN